MGNTEDNWWKWLTLLNKEIWYFSDAHKKSSCTIIKKFRNAQNVCESEILLILVVKFKREMNFKLNIAVKTVCYVNLK